MSLTDGWGHSVAVYTGSSGEFPSPQDYRFQSLHVSKQGVLCTIARPSRVFPSQPLQGSTLWIHFVCVYKGEYLNARVSCRESALKYPPPPHSQPPPAHMRVYENPLSLQTSAVCVIQAYCYVAPIQKTGLWSTNIHIQILSDIPCKTGYAPSTLLVTCASKKHGPV